MIKKITLSVISFCLLGSIAYGLCPTASAGADITICVGDTVQLIGSDPGLGTPEWAPEITVVFGFPLPSFVTLLPDGGNDTIKVTVPIAGTYKMYYSIAVDGCPTLKDSMNLSVIAGPASSLVSPYAVGFAGFGANATITNCTGLTTYTVIGNSLAAGETGTWAIEAPGAGTIVQTDSAAVVSGLALGTTTLTWTVDNGACASVSTVTINVGNTLPTTAVAGSDVSGCAGNSIQLIGNTPSSGDPVWSDPSPFSITPGVSIAPLSGANDTVDVTLNKIGTYTLYYTISIGAVNPGDACTSRDSLEITVDCTTGIDENSNDELEVLVQPNPASGSIRVSLTDSQASETVLEVLSPLGDVVMLKALGSLKGFSEVLDISGLTPGIYIVKVNKAEKVYTTKLMVQ